MRSSQYSGVTSSSVCRSSLAALLISTSHPPRRSISWHLGLEDLTLYQIAKAGIEGLTRSLARELGRDNIRVTTIVPGNVQTPRQAKWYTPEGEDKIVAAQCLDGRIQPADVAALALFLASDDARLCTAHEYFVDAGWR